MRRDIAARSYGCACFSGVRATVMHVIVRTPRPCDRSFSKLGRCFSFPSFFLARMTTKVGIWEAAYKLSRDRSFRPCFALKFALFSRAYTGCTRSRSGILIRLNMRNIIRAVLELELFPSFLSK